MQSPAEFSRDHQPAYVPATSRMLAGVLTMGVYALVLVVASHRSPVPNRAPSSELAARMEPDMPQPAHRQAVQEQDQEMPQNAPQETHRNAAQKPLRQQAASRQPSFLERLFRTQTAAPVPSMAPQPDGQSAPTPSPAEQMASAAPSTAQPAPGTKSSSQSGTARSPCQDAAWVRAVTNRVRHFLPPRRQNGAGLATAHLVIRRSGWLNELEIIKTSGKPALDAAAYAMLRKAQPLPRIPDRIATDRIELQLPIAFGVAGDFKITVSCDT